MNWKLKNKYAALLDQEKGYVKKVWGTANTVCLCYPNYYRVGMANLGFQTVYKMFNDQPSFLCERVFLPDDGEYAEFTSPAELFSLENKKPLASFDIVAFSLSFENDYPNILKILDLAGIPLRARDRTVCHPLIIGGGIAATLNPEPLADFFDLFILGEAEETLPVFTGYYEKARKSGLGRHELLLSLQREVAGIYVPGLYEMEYTKDSKIKSIKPLIDNLPKKIVVRPVKNLDNYETAEVISAPLVSLEDMYLIEVSRGCPHRCRFCAACFVYHPARFRSKEKIFTAIDIGLKIKNKIGLVGTAVSEHPALLDIGDYILSRGGKAAIGSLRLDRINQKSVNLLKRSGIETVALAPEAGSQRLRDMLNKGIDEEDVMKAAEILISEDIKNLRLYFMVGLPEEEDQDIDAIIELAKKIQHHALYCSQGKKKFRRITLSVNQFIPKPRTPLERCALADVNLVAKKIKKIVSAFKHERLFQVIHDVPKWNYLQALLSSGDRRVGEIMLAAHQFHGNWPRAYKEVNINPDFYVYREKQQDEILPWSFIEFG